MQALVVDEPDAALRRVALPRPTAAPGQVLVRVLASGVNPLDLKIRSGGAAHARHPLPAVLGIDLAGTVEVVGAGVSEFAVGDQVYGMTGGVSGHQGSLAEYAAVDAALLARKPANLSFREAAAIPLVFITAWEGLIDHAKLQAGQTVLVQGGAGGVGSMAVQVARAFGAKVYATESDKKRSIVESLGATFIERSTPIEEIRGRHTGGRGFDIVFDTVGGAVLDASFALVKRFGHVVSALGWGTHALAPLSFRAATYSGVFTLVPLLTGEGRAHHGEILREATLLAEEGQVRPILDSQLYTLEAANEAHAAVRDGTARGKVVVQVAAA